MNKDALVTVNLLPLAERGSRYGLPRMLAVLTMFVFLLLAVIYTPGLYLSWKLERQLQDCRNQWELLRPAHDKMLQAGAIEKQIREKTDLLIMLTQERKSWYAILTHLGTVLPQGVRLTEVTATGQKSLQVKGMAFGYPEVARFMQSLYQDALFDNPVLVAVEQEEALPSVRFELIANFKE